MDLFLIILALGYTAADKLDRSYLPPPGSKYAGGSPGVIDLPLEYPKTPYQTEQGLNQSKPFDVSSKVSVTDNSKNKFGRPSNSQAKEYIVTPTESFQTEFSVGKPNTESESGQNGKTNFDVIYKDGNYVTNGIRADGSNKIPLDKFQDYENRIIMKKPGYTKSSMEQNGYENVNNNSQLDSQEQEAINTPKNKTNQFDYTTLIETGQEFGTTSGRLPIQKPDKSSDNVKESVYGIDNFEIKTPFGINMYKDSTYYGSQAMYRPDTINSAVDRVNSALSSSEIPNYTSYLNYKDDINVIEMSYPDDVRSQTSSNFPKFDSVSFNRPSTIYEEDKMSLPKASENINVPPNSIANQVVTRPKYKRPVRPQAEADRSASIFKYESILTPEGFSYSYDTSNGIHADESGTATDGVKAKGTYSYTGDDGKVYTVKYTADENGFRPIGDHLPTPPPIPIEIQAALNQIAYEQEADNLDDGSYDERKYGYEKYQGKMDRFIPRLQNLSMNTQSIQNTDNNNFKTKPVDMFDKNQKESVNNQVIFQINGRYPSTRPTNTISDTNDKIAGITIPYSTNRKYSKNDNLRMQYKPGNQIKTNQKVIKRPTPNGFNDAQPELDINPVFISKPEDNASKTSYLSNDDKKAYKLTDQIINNDNVEHKTVFTNINRYLPKSNENKFGQNTFSNKRIQSEIIASPNFENNLQVTTSPDSKTFIPTTATQQMFDESDQDQNNNLKISENSGYYPPDNNFKETRYTTVDTSTPNLNQYKTDGNEYIPRLRTNYDVYANNKFDPGFGFPSTTEDAIKSTEKYFNTYSSAGDDKKIMPPYQFTSNYYDEKTPSTNYDPETTIGTKTPYYQEFTKSVENRPGITQKILFKPGQKYKYTQSEEYTTPIPAESTNYNGRTTNLPTSKESYYNKIISVRPENQNTTINNSGHVFTGYTYEKPSSYGNYLSTDYIESKPDSFSLSEAKINKDTTTPKNRFDLSNKKDRISPEKNFEEFEEPNYYSDDNIKNTKYNLFGNTNEYPIKETNINYKSNYNYNSPDTIVRPFEEIQHLGENESNKKNSLQPNVSTITSPANSTVNNQKEKDSNRIISEYDRLPESGQDYNTPYDQNIKKPTKGRDKLDESRYIADDTDRNEFITTEMVIGEDFSGPKRPQGFDPVTGYYY